MKFPQDFILVAGLALAVLVGVCVKPPAAAELPIRFTSPGDNQVIDSTGAVIGAEGTPAGYIVYYSTVPFDSTTYSQADSLVFNCAGPLPAGELETCVITGLAPETDYWIMAVAFDEQGNRGDPGNVAQGTTPDDVKPAAILDLAIDL